MYLQKKTIIFVINIPVLTKPTLSYYVRRIPNKNNESLDINIYDVVLSMQNILRRKNVKQIRYKQTKIEIFGKIYNNELREFQQILALNPIKNLTGYTKVISLENMKIEDIENLKEINEVKYIQARNTLTLGSVMIISL